MAKSTVAKQNKKVKKKPTSIKQADNRRRAWTRHPVTEWCFIVFGVFCLAYSIDTFIEPSKLVTGGATGLGILGLSIFEDYFHITYPLWLSNLIINAPLFIMAWIAMGRRFVWRSLISTALLSVALYICNYFPSMQTGIYPTGTDMLLAAVFGGALDGFAVGVVLRNGSTTGGSDIAGSLVHHYKPHVPISRGILLINGAIIAAGAYVYGTRVAMYAIIAVFVSSRMLDVTLEGMSYSKAAFIISDYAERIGSRILYELERGVTALNGFGFYTKTPKNVIMCVVSAKEIVLLKQIAQEEDERAFVIVTDAREVMGEGFKARH